MSGKECPSGRLLDYEFGRVPGKLEFDVWIGDLSGNLIDTGVSSTRATKYSFSLQLYADGLPTWIEHPSLGSDSDVVAIKLTDDILWANLHPGVRALGMNLIGQIGSMVYFDLSDANNFPRPAVTDQVFIVGYPLLASESITRFPIYKAGSVASEPADPLDPRFYVDAKSKPGMSGSPVVMSDHVAALTNGLDGGELKQTTKLLGVYSGRSEERKYEYEAELGLVWPIQRYLLPILYPPA